MKWKKGRFAISFLRRKFSPLIILPDPRLHNNVCDYMNGVRGHAWHLKKSVKLFTGAAAQQETRTKRAESSQGPKSSRFRNSSTES